MQYNDSTHSHALQPLSNMTLAYSDGACRGNGGNNAKGGFGTVIVLVTGEQLDICGGEEQTTNNRMELMGAIAALDHSPRELPIQIWTDSSYVKNGITQWLTGWKHKGWRKADGKPVLNVDLWQRLDEATQNRQIDWRWVKGHAGHDGNEYADKLANRGIDNLPKRFDKIILPPVTIQSTEQANSAVSHQLKGDSDKVHLDNLNSKAMKKSSNHPSSNPLTDEPTTMNDKEVSGLDNPLIPPLADHHQAMTVEEFSQYDTGLATDISEDWILSELDVPDVSEEQIAQQTTSPSPIDKSHKSSSSLYNNFINEQGEFIAQDESLIAQRPVFDGITSQPNITFVPLLPIAKHQGMANRQLILDTETTGFDAQNGDRIIEVGIVELINRKFTGEKLHVYINPHKQMDEEVIRIHGIHNAFLDGMPSFEQVGKSLYAFLQGAELIAHNANFDMNFLQAEFARLGLPDINQQVSVVDSLAIAKQLYAGQRNTLDALVKRLNVGKQDRTFHGALLDAEILAEVYLAMTGGQVALAIDEVVGGGVDGTGEHTRFNKPVARVTASEADENNHLAWLTSLASKYPELASNWGMAIVES